MPNDVLAIGGKNVPYRLEKGKSQRIGLRFRNAELVVVTPDGKWHPEAEVFIQEKSAWIVKHYSRLQEAERNKANYLAGLHRVAMLHGRLRSVHFTLGAPDRRFQLAGDSILLKIPEHQEPRGAYRLELISAGLSQYARHYLAKRLAHWCTLTELQYNRLRIKMLRSRWGSCSQKQNINLNFHLVQIPEALSDYVIVHELMHLHEMNHSPRFWRWVEHYLPDYRSRRTQLKDYQWLLGLYASENAATVSAT